jgi:ABC-2 type transport system permease protein
MGVYLHLVRLYIRTKMEYRLSFLIHIVSMFINYACAFGAIYVLVARFDMLGGWGWPELALLLSFQLLAYALGAATSFVQFRDLEDMVRRGSFDVILTKPISPWGYIVFSGLHIDYAGHIVLALGLMVWALMQLDVAWSPALAVYGVLALVNGCLVVASVLTMIGASALVLVQSRAFYAIFFSFWELTRYPLTIFPVAVQWLLFTIVPLAYMNFVPVAVFLGKPIGVIGDLAPALSLVSGPISVLAAMAFWRFCLSRYQSGGG